MTKFIDLSFYRCIIDSQLYGSNKEHVVSRVFFKIIINGKEQDLFVDVRQDDGGDFSYMNDPLIVTNPFPNSMPFNYESFREEVEKYYRKCIGKNSSVIDLVNSTNVRISDLEIKLDYHTGIRIVENSAAW